MRVDDVTIGDWVYVTSICGWECDPIAQQVRAIEYHSYRGSDYCDWVSMDCDDEVSLTNIEPIPLTQEILRMNGFRLYARYTGEDIWMEYNHNIEVVITNYASTIRVFTIDDIDDGYNLIYLQDVGRTRYVHELQHALRLLGLNELANNLKI